MGDARSGADAFLDQLGAAGVRWIFGNPGTTEQAVIDKIQDHEGIALVVALHEGVAVAAADGYARASGGVGVVEVHAGPGLGNALGTLYNARMGGTPLLVYVGQSEQSRIHTEPTLSGDFTAYASPWVKWAYEIRSAEEIPQVVRRALKVADTPPRGPVVLSLPFDLSTAPCAAPALPPSRVPTAVRPDPKAIEDAVRLLVDAKAPALIVGDGVVASGAIAEVGALARLLGAPVFGGSMSEVCVDPDEPLRAARLPFEGAAAERLLAPYDAVVAVGTKVLAQIFPLAGPPLGGRRVVHIGLDPWELAKNQPSAVVFGDERLAIVDLLAALQAAGSQRARGWGERRARVAADLESARERALAADRARWDASPMTPARALAEVAAALPANVYLADETISSYGVAARYLRLPAGHWFRGRGGGVGIGMAMALGVQLAHPDAPVLGIVADGSAMYSLTALWTGAHHDLPVVWAILNNKSYRLLKQNTIGYRGAVPGRAFVGADLTDPDIDFVALAKGMGVEGCRIGDPAAIGPALRAAFDARRPALLDLVVSGDVS
ncbi:MAG TPA: thiamine pyrophosphate-binding protein [Candidatus Limnocylindria bacterium]|nr:thiamine pyrophosphate-binding protein [Candidatus Limnocylindria bacterium]